MYDLLTHNIEEVFHFMRKCIILTFTVLATICIQARNE